jgi:hypothetical protein
MCCIIPSKQYVHLYFTYSEGFEAENAVTQFFL